MYIANSRGSVLLQASGEFRLPRGSRKVSFGVNSLVTFFGENSFTRGYCFGPTLFTLARLTAWVLENTKASFLL